MDYNAILALTTSTPLSGRHIYILPENCTVSKKDRNDMYQQVLRVKKPIDISEL